MSYSSDPGKKYRTNPTVDLINHKTSEAVCKPNSVPEISRTSIYNTCGATFSRSPSPVVASGNSFQIFKSLRIFVFCHGFTCLDQIRDFFPSFFLVIFPSI
ncbi:Uncharacterized protein TCM_034026 [Theobroma cacao]|uniref:Uncharacterized protein n=1 Tax=Theobroma cacao TaxID=3641 RepID=A0A061FCX8_THECC|nr:Uncharacterized protein TCM_034026 [Theobroma cacao]